MAAQTSDTRLPTDLEALRYEMDDLRLVRLALNVLDFRLTSDLASEGFKKELRALMERIEARDGKRSR